MSIVTPAEVAAKFPKYQEYFLDADGAYDEDVLQADIDDAETFVGEFITFTASTITAAIKLHIHNVIKKLGFVRQYGDVKFDDAEKPQIIKDYEMTLKKLQSFKAYEEGTTGANLTGTGLLSITANGKKFTGGKWFIPDGTETGTELDD